MTDPKFTNGTETCLSVAHVVEQVVDSAPGYNDRDVAELRRKVDALTELVGALALQLTPDQQKAFVDWRCYGWTPQ